MDLSDGAPAAFICSITKDVMADPVTCDDGQSYERHAIERWFQTHTTSPNTRARCSQALTPNFALRSAIEEWRAKHFKLIKIDDLTLGPQIGSGSFNAVFRATLVVRSAGAAAPRTITVAAARRLHADDAATEEEVKTLIKLSAHPNLVRYIGLCVGTAGSPPPHIITEFAEHGSLDALMGRLMEAEGDHHDALALSESHQNSVLRQICSGMEALADESIVHRDLAARNVLVFAFDRDDAASVHVKVSDFGLSVDKYGKTYRTVDGENVPFRWMSPEALKKRRFSEKSDVWAFGVTAWEILSDGDMPYFLVDDDAALKRGVIEGTLHLERPEGVSDAQWALVESCWCPDQRKRPTFARLGASLAAGGGDAPESRGGEAELPTPPVPPPQDGHRDRAHAAALAEKDEEVAETRRQQDALQREQAAAEQEARHEASLKKKKKKKKKQERADAAAKAARTPAERRAQKFLDAPQYGTDAAWIALIASGWEATRDTVQRGKAEYALFFRPVQLLLDVYAVREDVKSKHAKKFAYMTKAGASMEEETAVFQQRLAVMQRLLRELATRDDLVRFVKRCEHHRDVLVGTFGVKLVKREQHKVLGLVAKEMGARTLRDAVLTVLGRRQRAEEEQARARAAAEERRAAVAVAAAKSKGRRLPLKKHTGTYVRRVPRDRLHSAQPRGAQRRATTAPPPAAHAPAARA